MKQRIPKFFRSILSLFFVVFLIWAIYHDNYREIWDVVKNIPIEMLFLIVGLGLFYLCAEAFTSLFSYGIFVPYAQAASAMLLYRISTYFLPFFISMLVTMKIRRKRDKKERVVYEQKKWQENAAG